MAYRNKIYVAFDGDNDIKYYEIMKAWDANKNVDFEFNDAHDLHQASDTSLESSIKASLLDRFKNSKIFILLVGEHTKYLRKFVKWEIETSIRLELPIICVNLNGSAIEDENCPSSLDGHLALFIPFEEDKIKGAINNWPDQDAKLRKEGQTGHYHY